jgi:putative addiction module killer protein
VIPSETIDIREYVRPSGNSPFGRWFIRLDAVVAARVSAALARLAAGSWSNVRSLGGGVHELRLHFGPGYRVYFGKIDAHVVILVGGGTKSGQARDIARARDLWTEFKMHNRELGNRCH